jgi:hypothetical protein
MNKILFYLIFLAAQSSFGQQKEELRKLCHHMKDRLEGTAPLHLEYVLTVKGRGGEENKMTMQIFRKDTLQQMILGEAQEVLRQGKTILVVSHGEKYISVAQDSAANRDFLTGQLDMMADSASQVIRTQKDGQIHFLLNYTSSVYTRVELDFSRKTGELRSLYAEFSQDYPMDYASVKADYRLWDTSWRPEPGFPGMDRFVARSGNIFSLQPAWKEYQFFQPQKGTLKF